MFLGELSTNPVAPVRFRPSAPLNNEDEKKEKNMATKSNIKEVTNSEEAMAESQGVSEATPRKKRVLKRKLASHLPFIKWHVGLTVCGEITRKFTNNGTYGEKSNIEIQLLDPLEFTDSEGEVKGINEGERVQISQVAGLTQAFTLNIGDTVQIECTGKKQLDKGRQPAWEFEVTYE